MYITALIKLNPKEFDELKSIYFGDIYFPVIRQGISEEPKEMRFGQSIWSRDEETVTFKIYLVDKKHDEEEDNSLGLFQPEMGNIKDLLAANTEKFFSLLKILEQKKILTSDEIEQVHWDDANINKIWTLRNNGHKSWQVGTALKYISGHRQNVSSVAVKSLKPKKSMRINLIVNIPMKPGIYETQFRLVAPNAEQFGDILTLIYRVV